MGADRERSELAETSGMCKGQYGECGLGDRTQFLCLSGRGPRQTIDKFAIFNHEKIHPYHYYFRFMLI